MKKLKSFIFLFFLVILLSGCNNTQATLTINSNKSVDLNIKILVEDGFDEMPYLNNISSYEKRNINIKRIVDTELNGYLITKSYSNIDKISVDRDVDVNIINYMNSDFEDKELFRVDQGEYENKYTASFIVDKDTIRSIVNDIENKNKESFYELVKEIYNKSLETYSNSKTEITYSSEKNELSLDDDITYSVLIDRNGNVDNIEVSNSKYNYSYEKSKILEEEILINDVVSKNINNNNDILKFVVKLPKKSLSNNADIVSGSGETLTWTFNLNDSKNSIKFSFMLDNTISRISLFAFIIIVPISIIILISIIVKINKSKRNNIEKEPIYKSYDESISNIINNKEENIKDNEIQVIEDEKSAVQVIEPDIETPINVYESEKINLEKTMIINIDEEIEKK